MTLAMSEPPRAKGRKRQNAAATLSPLEAEIIALFVQMSRALGHPCKIYNILNVGAPVLYIGPRLSHISELTENARGEVKWWSAGHGEVGRVVEQILCARNVCWHRPSEISSKLRSLFSQEAVLPKLIAELESA